MTLSTPGLVPKNLTLVKFRNLREDHEVRSVIGWPSTTTTGQLFFDLRTAIKVRIGKGQGKVRIPNTFKDQLVPRRLAFNNIYVYLYIW